MSGNLTAVREMSGILLKIRELSGNFTLSGEWSPCDQLWSVTRIREEEDEVTLDGKLFSVNQTTASGLPACTLSKSVSFTIFHFGEPLGLTASSS